MIFTQLITNLFMFVSAILQPLGVGTLCLQSIHCAIQHHAEISSQNCINNPAVTFLLVKGGSCIKMDVACLRFHMVPSFRREEENPFNLNLKN